MLLISLRHAGRLLALLGALIAASPRAAADTNAAAPLTLEQAWQLALTHHPRLAAARFEAGAAAETANAVRATELPQVSLALTAAGEDSAATRILAGGINTPSVYDRFAGGLAVSQLITDFGRTANLKAGARLEAEAGRQTAADVREQVWLTAATSYYGVLNAQAVRQVARETVQTRQLLLAQVTALATNRLKSELDVSFAQVRLAEGQLLLERAQNALDAAQARLASALGLREIRPWQLVEPVVSEPGATAVEALIQTALGHRPELLSLRAERDADYRLASAERAAANPTVSAVGVLGNSPLHDSHVDDNYAAADLNVSVPVFTGGLYAARRHRAELKAAAADEDLRTAEDDIIREVRVAWLDLNNTRALLATTGELVTHATEAFDLARARYDAGLGSIVELSEAQLSLISARIEQASAHYDLLIQAARLDYQTGVRH